MADETLAATARALLVRGKGVLAIDDFPEGLNKRLTALDIPSTEDMRHAYRQLLLETVEAMRHVSGVIFHEESLSRKSGAGMSHPMLANRSGALVGLKLDEGQAAFPGSPQENETRGIDTLPRRCLSARAHGVRFAKWRAVYRIGANLPSEVVLSHHARQLALFAQNCLQAGLVPIVEPDVLMEGDHGLEQCEAITGLVLARLFSALKDKGVWHRAILLKPNMITAGSQARPAAPEEMADATRRCLLAHVPRDVAGIALLSGGQSPLAAIATLNAIVMGEALPWPVTFSFNRALTDETFACWRGRPENRLAAQTVFAHRMAMASLAALGRWSPTLEGKHEQ